MSNIRLSTLRNRVESVNQTVRREFPQAAMFASFSFVALASIGERATSTRKRRMSLVSLLAMGFMVGPAVGQGASIGCQDGPLAFISDLYDIISMSAGMIIGAMIIVAALCKMAPMRGTNTIGNALIGSVVVGIAFLILGPAVVDIAAKSSPVNMNVQC
ncbi:MAG TPA: hypothetical protein VFJ06_03250 [Halococcus sp.]|jgi:hypothetical protein|nr:hypothetical protein [Halococcus sp.]